MPAEIVDKKLLIDGYTCYKARAEKGKIYWACRRGKAKECAARAITLERVVDGNIEVIKGPNESKHSHPPNREETAAEKIIAQIKRKAAEHPEQRPAQLLRTELQGVPSGVLSQLPEQTALSGTVRRTRRKNLPPNPQTLSELEDVPDIYKKTLVGEQFLLYDSRSNGLTQSDSSPDEDEEKIVRKIKF